ncbi:unnamed protein product [Phaeothamnion confervicola]
MYGDALAQCLESSSGAGLARLLVGSGLDLQRMAVFGVVGACYLAPLVHVWYSVLERRIGSGPAAQDTSVRGRLFTSARMVAVDQTLASPVVNAGFLFFFSLFSSVASTLASTHVVGPGAAVGVAAAKVTTSIAPTLQAAWRIWPIANLINFAFVPPHLRLLFANFVGIFWNIILSTSLAGQ